MDSRTPPTSGNAPRLIAFFLTQFHPTRENDAWWGKGFTEWTNVTRAAPLFEGHYQPHLPADLGFYDLRVRQTRHEQIAAAKRYGIDAFCYYYYWFSGQRLLSAPLDDMLADAESDMPFCLCWANENWTRRWDGRDREVLIAQRYLPDDDINFIRSVAPFLADQRYLKVDGRPLLIVYQPQHLKNARQSVAVWRAHCRAEGLGEVHLCAALTHRNQEYAQFGFDSGLEFPPHNLPLDNINRDIAFRQEFRGDVFQYAALAQACLKRDYGASRVFRSVFPSWDNTARRGERALIVLNGTPRNYEFWLASTLDRAAAAGDAFVFINAWNEWAEGCHLEPDRRYGGAFLQATLDAANGVRRYRDFPDTGLPQDGPAPARTLRGDVAAVLRYHGRRTLERLRRELNRRPRLRFVLQPLIKLMRAARPTR